MTSGNLGGNLLLGLSIGSLYNGGPKLFDGKFGFYPDFGLAFCF